MVLSLLLVATSLAQHQPGGDPDRLVTLRQIRVEGTRFTRVGVARLTGWTPGDEVKLSQIPERFGRLISTGLIQSVTHEVWSLPDRDTELILTLHCVDVPPTARASIQIPKVDEGKAWKWLEESNELIVRQLPVNEAAIKLYCEWIARYMEKNGPAGFNKRHSIVAETTAADRVVFKAVKRK